MSRSVRLLLVFGAVAVLAGLSVSAQNIVSARSGLIHYVMGKVLLDDKPVEVANSRFPEMKEKSVLRTEEGRAEVLISPGDFYASAGMRMTDVAPTEGLASFLRVGENSSFRLVSNRLTDTRVEFLAGDILVECAEILKGNKVTLLYKDQEIELRKNGLYRVSGTPAVLRVYKGEATVAADGKAMVVKDGRQVALNGLGIIEKFNAKLGDPLYRWSKARSEYTALANVAMAKYMRENGYSWAYSGWRYNPWFGMYTFIPARGMYFSPFGYYFYCPRTVYYYYERPTAVASSGGGGFNNGPRYNSDLGYSTASRGSMSGSSGSVSSSPAASSAPASSPRTADSASPRDSGGGGRGR